MGTVFTQELKDKIIEDYKNSDPTAENSPEIVAEIAENLELSPNGVRLVLTQAGVYIKRVATAKPSASKDSGTKRVSKESAIAELKAAILEKGLELDEDILGKLTGKAAVYITQLVKG